jgi:hypothetical protein
VDRKDERAGEGTRTPDPLFTRQALYQLSYSGATAAEGTGIRGGPNVWLTVPDAWRAPNERSATDTAERTATG